MPFILRCDGDLHQEARARVYYRGLNVISLRIHLRRRESTFRLAPYGEGQREAQDPTAYPADFEPCKILLGLNSTHPGGIYRRTRRRVTRSKLGSHAERASYIDRMPCFELSLTWTLVCISRSVTEVVEM